MTIELFEAVGPDGALYRRGRRRLSQLQPSSPAPVFASRMILISSLSLTAAGRKTAERLQRIARNIYRVEQQQGLWLLQAPAGTTTHSSKDEAVEAGLREIVARARLGDTEAGVVEVDGRRRITYPAAAETVNLFAPFLVAASNDAKVIELRASDGTVFASFAPLGGGDLACAIGAGMSLLAYPRAAELPAGDGLAVRVTANS